MRGLLPADGLGVVILFDLSYERKEKTAAAKRAA
jgi:hypothetical protein